MRVRLRELANERRRVVYRRLFVVMRREGEALGVNHVAPLYHEKGLSVRKRRALAARPSARPRRYLWRRRPARAGQWIFVHDQLPRPKVARPKRRRRRNQEMPRRDSRHLNLRALGGAGIDKIVARRGKPGLIVSDNSKEFTCYKMLTWCRDNAVDWRFIAPGKSMQKGFSRASTVAYGTST
jgi:putative transposase